MFKLKLENITAGFSKVVNDLKKFEEQSKAAANECLVKIEKHKEDLASYEKEHEVANNIRKNIEALLNFDKR